MDPVPGYLAHARTTVEPAEADFVAGLVEQLPFADGAFDSCLSLLLLQEIHDRGRALREMHRVTRQGGIVAACQWDFQRGMPMSAAIREALDLVVPDVLERLGRRQGTAFTGEAELRQHWEAAGLAEVETTRLVTRLSYPDFDALWQPLLSGSTPVSAAVAALPPAAREEVHGRLMERLLGGGRNGSFSLAAEAFAVRGRAVGQTR